MGNVRTLTRRTFAAAEWEKILEKPIRIDPANVAGPTGRRVRVKEQ
jgi:hypothetical protein